MTCPIRHRPSRQLELLVRLGDKKLGSTHMYRSCHHEPHAVRLEDEQGHGQSSGTGVVSGVQAVALKHVPGLAQDPCTWSTILVNA